VVFESHSHCFACLFVLWGKGITLTGPFATSSDLWLCFGPAVLTQCHRPFTLSVGPL
jgi:hypothetical protein